MASWVAINEQGGESDSDEVLDVGNGRQETIEAQEMRITNMYERALRRLFRAPSVETDEWISVRNTFIKILCEPLLQNVQNIKSGNSSTSQKVKYLCLKNLAAMESKVKVWMPDALNHYAQALEIDDTDVVVLFDMGKVALQVENYHVARYSFERALIIQPMHWPSLLQLCQVLYILQNDEECFRVVESLLEMDAGNTIANEIKAALTAEATTRMDPFAELTISPVSARKRRVSSFKQIEQLRNKRLKRIEKPARPVVKVLDCLTWNDLGLLLLEIFETIESTYLKIQIQIDDGAEGRAERLNLEATSVAAALPEEEEVTIVDANGCPVPQSETIDDGSPKKQQNLNRPKKKQRAEPTRVSKRTIERLKAEHEAAAKEARQANIQYQLERFLGLRKETSESDDEEVPMQPIEHDFVWKWSEAQAFRDRKTDVKVLSNGHSAVTECRAIHEMNPMENTRIREFIDNIQRNSGAYDTIRRLLEYIARLDDVYFGPNFPSVLFWLERVVENSLCVSSKKQRPVSKSELSASARMFLAEFHLDAYYASNNGIHLSRATYHVTYLSFEMLTETLLMRIRRTWLKAQVFRLNKETQLAQKHFEDCLQLLDEWESQNEGRMISLPNSRYNWRVTHENIQKQITQLTEANVILQAKVIYRQALVAQ